MIGNVPMYGIKGLHPVDPRLLASYERQMSAAIPEIVRAVERRQILAADSRQREFRVPVNERGCAVHYRNGREAKNGDKVVQLGGYGDGAQVVAVGILYDATPGSDFCNGSIAPIQQPITGACMCDCLHVDDVAAMLKEKGFDKRPDGK